LKKIVCLLIGIFLVSCSGVQNTFFVPSEIERYCRRISEDAGNSRAMKTCVRQERSAREQLSAMAIPSDISMHCRRLADSTGGSYQVTLTCVQQKMAGL